MLASCLQLRYVLIALELAPLTLRKLKDDKKTREIQNVKKSSQPPPPGRGNVGISKMARVPEGENFFSRHTRPGDKQIYSLFVILI